MPYSAQGCGYALEGSFVGAGRICRRTELLGVVGAAVGLLAGRKLRSCTHMHPHGDV